MLVTEPSSCSMTGRHVRRSNVSPCTKTTGVPLPWMSQASPVSASVTVAMARLLRVSLRCNITPLQYTVK